MEATSTTTSSAVLMSTASLPRFIALESLSWPGGEYLTVHDGQFRYLTFTTRHKTRMVAHEVLHNTNEAGVLMLRAPNGRFWQRHSSHYILADRESTPGSPASDPACYFRAFRHGDHLLLQSLVDGQYIKRFTDRVVSHALHASGTGVGDIHSAFLFSSAVDVAVVLPRYILLEGDNQRYVVHAVERRIDWLKFHQRTPDLNAVHEVIPLVNGNFAIFHIRLRRYWRRSPEWIWLDVQNLSDAINNLNCQFDVVSLSSVLLAFRSVANNRLLRRHTEFWVDMLCAVGDTTNDRATHLLVKEAVLSRSFSNIRYLLNLAEVSEVTPVLVGSGSMWNNTSLTTNLEVQVTITQEVSNSQMWSTSTTFSTSVTVGFSVGVPLVASVEGSITVGFSRQISTEMGTTTTTAVSFQTTYAINDVPPGVEATVTVECTTAKCRIPFTYTSRDTRIDGVQMPNENRVDGIFEGVNAFNVRGVVSTRDRNGVILESMRAILPVEWS